MKSIIISTIEEPTTDYNDNDLTFGDILLNWLLGGKPQQ